jgi:hypothetical protein
VGAYTAFYVDLVSQTAEVVGVPGKSFVAIMGRESAAKHHERTALPFVGDGYTVSVLGVGDTYTLPDRAHPYGVASHPKHNESYKPFSRYYSDLPVFTDAFGRDVLIDNVVTYFADGTPLPSGARVDAIALQTDESGSATGFRTRFTADKDSAVAWNEDAGYSMFNARLQISTVSAQIGGLGP